MAVPSDVALPVATKNVITPEIARWTTGGGGGTIAIPGMYGLPALRSPALQCCAPTYLM
jgi:hypothetical protein